MMQIIVMLKHFQDKYVENCEWFDCSSQILRETWFYSLDNCDCEFEHFLLISWSLKHGGI